jgi:hypothetical protein
MKAIRILLSPILNLKKINYCEWASWSIFTTINFLRNLPKGPNEQDFVSDKPFQLKLLKYFNLLGPIISYKENEVL